MNKKIKPLTVGYFDDVVSILVLKGWADEMKELDGRIRGLQAEKYTLESKIANGIMEYAEDSKLRPEEVVVQTDSITMQLKQDRSVDPRKFKEHFGELEHIDKGQFDECYLEEHAETVTVPAKTYLRPIKKYVEKQGGEIKEKLDQCWILGTWRVKINGR